jgi:Bacterial DNA-binding protein.
MNETVTNNDLKKLVISQSGMEPAFVNIFIDQMCSIISEAIENGEDITIDGIGQFRTVSFEKGDKKGSYLFPTRQCAPE